MFLPILCLITSKSIVFSTFFRVCVHHAWKSYIVANSHAMLQHLTNTSYAELATICCYSRQRSAQTIDRFYCSLNNTNIIDWPISFFLRFSFNLNDDMQQRKAQPEEKRQPCTVSFEPIHFVFANATNSDYCQLAFSLWILLLQYLLHMLICNFGGLVY